MGPQLVHSAGQADERTSSHSTSPVGHISKSGNSGEELGGARRPLDAAALQPACSFEHVSEKQLGSTEAGIQAPCGCEAQQIRNTSYSVLVQGTGYPGATTALLLSGTCQMLTLIKPYQKHNLFLLTKCSCPCRYTDHKEGRLPMASTPLDSTDDSLLMSGLHFPH